MRDLSNHIATRQCIAPALRSSYTVTGTAIDILGFESLAFSVHVGDWTDGEHVVSLEHSEDDISYDAVAARYITGTALEDGTFFELTIGDNGDSPSGPAYENENLVFGYVGDRRFVRAKIVSLSAVTGAFIGIDAILGHAHQRPT
ncbi:hypothetical protein LRP31_23710 [Mesorhizobium mediterraneum]|uniref:Uncharacterized protein n=1 Tax=Mesorhizobium mediterraneum TaxID=43617 RepID=A0AB36QZX0_9HYPH|nr:hypothetical protein [Mesorhizobium mediterraneum]PAP97822.1 hypothetical protein CIT25_35135 [Mesorhizobium mediterraneum]WIW52053.1 hypothetical protein LRP31_23710 [Mesorhizobium mediterraneum]